MTDFAKRLSAEGTSSRANFSTSTALSSIFALYTSSEVDMEESDLYLIFKVLEKFVFEFIGLETFVLCKTMFSCK